MGEIIFGPTPPLPLPFTGERPTSEYCGQAQIEQFHRYLHVREWCRGKDVLDVASGEGYGTALLAQVASSALGLEIAPDAVEHANRAYKADNLRFINGDAWHLPNPDATFDVVISFEIIEHFFEQTQFLREVRRVLRPGGIFIVSTSDQNNHSPAETSANSYHVKELTGTKFRSLLQSHFAEVSILRQRPVFGSILLPDEGNGALPLCFERRGEQHFEGSVGLSRAQYLVAFASDNRTQTLPPSVYIDTGQVGMLSPTEAEVRLRSVEAMLASAQGEARGLLVANEMTEAAIPAMRAELLLATQRQRLLEAQINSIFASRSWRMTAFVRAVGRRLRRRS